MEDVGSIFMHMNAPYLTAIDIAPDVCPAVDHQATEPLLCCLIGKGSPEEACACYEIVVVCHFRKALSG